MKGTRHTYMQDVPDRNRSGRQMRVSYHLYVGYRDIHHPWRRAAVRVATCSREVDAETVGGRCRHTMKYAPALGTMHLLL